MSIVITGSDPDLDSLSTLRAISAAQQSDEAKVHFASVLAALFQR